jgi:bacterioferritin (cytochrome b1)
MMDDVLATQEEHNDHLQEVLQPIHSSGMTLNPERCNYPARE